MAGVTEAVLGSAGVSEAGVQGGRQGDGKVAARVRRVFRAACALGLLVASVPPQNVLRSGFSYAFVLP